MFQSFLCSSTLFKGLMQVPDRKFEGSSQSGRETSHRSAFLGHRGAWQGAGAHVTAAEMHVSSAEAHTLV